MTTAQIIDKFRLYVDDSSELSSAQELALAEKIYRQVLDEHDFEFLKKEYSGTTSGDYISLPSDFKNIAINYTQDGEPEQVVFVGSTFEVYKVIPFSERRSYRDHSNCCYIDKRQNRLYFTSTPSSGLAVEFDYIYNPDALTTGTSPVFDAIHHDIIYHGMVMDYYSIEQTEKGRAYFSENSAWYQKFLTRMKNVNLKNTGRLTY